MQLKERFYSRAYINLGDQVGYRLHTMDGLYPMVLNKYFLFFGLSVPCSKNIFILKCGCFSGSNLVYIANCIFWKNLQRAQPQKIMSFRSNYCGR